MYKLDLAKELRELRKQFGIKHKMNTYDRTADRIEELEAQVERYKTALHQISLSAQNSMSDKAEGGRIARAAIKGEKSGD